MMDTPRQHRDSQLFTVRLWAEVSGDNQIEWRGKLLHVLSGEVRYFRDWTTLISALSELLSQQSSPKDRP